MKHYNHIKLLSVIAACAFSMGMGASAQADVTSCESIIFPPPKTPHYACKVAENQELHNAYCTYDIAVAANDPNAYDTLQVSISLAHQNYIQCIGRERH
jgi:hypothetical protein